MDLIDRQQAIDEANAWLLECLKVQKQDRSCGLIRRLEDLPSVQKTGHWQKYEGRFDYDWECSECGCSSYEKTDWCAHCGAKMGEEDE